MVLTLEDAYYDHHGTNMHGAHDPLGLAVAKMSYHVYSLGEGIVGQVAVSGEHQWVFPENYNNCNSAFEFHNVWESQISAGIKVFGFFFSALSVCFIIHTCQEHPQSLPLETFLFKISILPSPQTILVVAVGPCGVVQLGSLCKVSKILKLDAVFAVTK
jgi:hypothetical protein